MKYVDVTMTGEKLETGKAPILELLRSKKELEKAIEYQERNQREIGTFMDVHMFVWTEKRVKPYRDDVLEKAKVVKEVYGSRMMDRTEIKILTRNEREEIKEDEVVEMDGCLWKVEEELVEFHGEGTRSHHYLLSKVKIKEL